MGQGGALGSGVYPSSPLRTQMRRDAGGLDGWGSEPAIGLHIPLATYSLSALSVDSAVYMQYSYETVRGDKVS